MFCSNCGKETLGKFCQECGAPVLMPEDKRDDINETQNKILKNDQNNSCNNNFGDNQKKEEPVEWMYTEKQLKHLNLILRILLIILGGMLLLLTIVSRICIFFSIISFIAAFKYKAKNTPKKKPTFQKSISSLSVSNERSQRTIELEKQGVAYCPKCLSTSLSAHKKGFGVGKAVVGGLAFGPLGLVGGNINAKKVRVTCLKCGHQFWAGKR